MNLNITSVKIIFSKKNIVIFLIFILSIFFYFWGQKLQDQAKILQLENKELKNFMSMQQKNMSSEKPLTEILLPSDEGSYDIFVLIRGLEDRGIQLQTLEQESPHITENLVVYNHRLQGRCNFYECIELFAIMEGSTPWRELEVKFLRQDGMHLVFDIVVKTYYMKGNSSI